MSCLQTQLDRGRRPEPLTQFPDCHAVLTSGPAPSSQTIAVKKHFAGSIVLRVL